MSLTRLLSAGLAATFLAASFGLALPAPAEAQTLSNQQAVTSLVTDLSAMKSLHATFSQSVNDARNASLQEVAGTMWIARPGLFRWDTNDPYPQQIISDSNVLWIYDLDLEQVTKRKLDKQVGNTPALLLSGDPAQLDQSFTITASRDDATSEIRYDLVPKAKDALFELLRVHFRNGRLNDMFLRDNLGQTTRIQFQIKSYNEKIDPSIFSFVPPQGVDVIEDL